MHARQRNGLGNGYSSNSFGVGGMAATSRISPDGSMRVQRMYNNQYRNNIRGAYGRGGHLKQSQLLPPQETDIFVEAGRLAAEYLVSKGLLPPNSLSGKWLPDGSKNEMNNFQGFRQHGPDKTLNAADGRASVHSRLRNAAPEAGPGRRRFSDEYNAMGSKISGRGRKKTGSLRYGSEMNRELGRSGSWAEKSGVSPGTGASSDASVGHHTELPEDKDGISGGRSLSPGEVNDSDLNNEKNLPSVADGETTKRSDDENTFNDEADVAKGGNEGRFHSKHDEIKDANESKSQLKLDESKDHTMASEDHLDLAKQCKFVHVPTKARTSLTKKASKGNKKPVSEVERISSREHSEGSGAQMMDVDKGNSSCSVSSHQNHQLSLESNVLNAPTIEKEPDIACSTKPALCIEEAGSFPEISVCNENESGEGPSRLQSPNSMVRETNEKRVLDHKPDDREDYKKLRQLVSSVDDQSDDSLPLSSLMKIQRPSRDPGPSSSDFMTLSSDQKGLGMSLLPKSQTDSCKFMEEKQLFPGSFKTCDLNLSGTCDVNDNNEADPMLILPYVTQPRKVGGPVDIDLSMGNNDNLDDKICKIGSKNLDVEVIDLENDSAQEHGTFSNPVRRADALFPDLEGFSNNMHNDNGVPDTQDGYGLMISELLGNDSPNCSSVPPDLNSLQNHMGLTGTEGMLGDDESIYMSLGEIPISLLGPWEQPSHDYGKPF